MNSIPTKMMALAEKVKLRDYKLAHELQELARELNEKLKGSECSNGTQTK